MKRHTMHALKFVLACSFIVACSSESAFAQGKGLNRLLNQAPKNQESTNEFQPVAGEMDSQTMAALSGVASCASNACLIPNAIESAERVRRATYTQEPLNFADSTGFGTREVHAVPNLVMPTPLAYGMRVYGVDKPSGDALKISTPGYNGWNPNAGRDEYVFDGNDRGKTVRVDQSWNVYGLETEDTVGHFDTLDGKRIVTPSNRVAIYAPRFGAVRKLDGVFNAKLQTPVVALEERTPIAHAAGRDISASSKQNVALNRYEGASRASGFVDRTRGVVADTVVEVFGYRNNFSPFENLSLMKLGKYSGSESARLNLGMQSASVWEDNLGLQVVGKKIAPVIVRDLKTIQELVRVESEDGSAILRVTKIASKIAARTGETVEFTIRYDNMSGKRIGNVTIIDNLTRRLEYIDKSAESSLRANFVNKQNDGGSLMLRWEIIEPIDPHTGGIIRFKCRVR